MNNKVVVLGGGTGQSTLLKGLKMFPMDITAVVAVSDDGSSSGKLRQEFNTPAVGDLRRVLVALSETENIVGELFNYRFHTTSDLDGHTVGNILLTALTEISGNLSSGIKQFSKILNMKGNVLPLTDDNVILMAKMTDGSVIEGEHFITESKKKIKKVFYKKNPKINKDVIKSLKESNLIVLSMGSIYTSIIPNLISKDIIKAIDSSNAKIVYICNLVTQPGESDNFKVSDHINLLNKYLGKKKIDLVIANSEKIYPDIKKKYSTLEKKNQVEIDKENISIKLISKPFLTMENGYLRHDCLKISLELLNYLLKK